MGLIIHLGYIDLVDNSSWVGQRFKGNLYDIISLCIKFADLGNYEL